MKVGWCMRFYYGSHVIRKIIKTCLCCLFLFFISCPSSEEKKDGKTYLKINNNTKYTVNVYINDPPLYNDTSTSTLRQISAGGSEQWELQPPPAGTRTMLYFEYLIPVGSATIPYYPRDPEYAKTIILEAGKTNSQEVPSLLNAQTDSIFVLIKNTSKFDPFWVRQGNATKTPFGSSGNNISAGEDALFVFDGNTTSFDGYTIGDIIKWNFPNISLEKGMIYSFMFDGQSSPVLYLMEYFDPAMQRMIWTIPSYESPIPGKILSVGLFQSRQNVKNDGYILAGRINYGLHTITAPQVGAIPYLGLISPNGDVTNERKITIRKNPGGINIQQFLEEQNELVFIGQAYYEAYDGQPFILSTDLYGEVNYFYDDFINDIDANHQYLYGNKLEKFGSNGYLVGCRLYNDLTGKSQVSLLEVRKTGWDTVSHKEFWKSPVEDDVWIDDLIYDVSQNMFIVAAFDNNYNYNIGELSSILYFVDAANGTEKYLPIKSTRYAVNKIFVINGDYYVIGQYSGASRLRGFIAKINISNGTLGDPLLIDSSKYINGSVNIKNVLLDDDGMLLLGGWCVEDSSDTQNSKKMPWLVKYNMTASTKIWEQIYNDHKGYTVNSVHHNAIGSYLLETQNPQTNHSYLVSTDLLGGMSDNTLPPLPRNSSMFSAAAPGEPVISAVVTPLSDDANLSVTSLSIIKGQSGNITVNGTWTSYQWYVNGSRMANTTNNYTFSTTDRDPGIYTVTVIVTNNANEKRSASCRVTVTTN